MSSSHARSASWWHQAFGILFRSDCQHFELKEPDFVAVEELKLDIEQYEGMWSLYEEFNGGLQDMAKEDWISFRWGIIMLHCHLIEHGHEE